MAEIENLKIGNGGTLHIVGNEDIVANAWQADKTYVKNKSYVIREHRLYVCNVTHTSVEPFDTTKWTEITIGDAIGNNIGDLSQLTTSDKSSLVNAIKEVNAKYTNLGFTRIARGTANMDTTTKTITLSGFTSTPTIVATPYAYFKEVWITSASSSGFTINMNSTGAFVNWIAIGN